METSLDSAGFWKISFAAACAMLPVSFAWTPLDVVTLARISLILSVLALATAAMVKHHARGVRSAIDLATLSARSGSREESAGDGEFKILCAQVVPVWTRHVETARAQTEQAIEQLTGNFSQI